VAELRILAHHWLIDTIHIENQYAVFSYTSAKRIRQLAGIRHGQLRVVDERSAYLPLDKGVTYSHAILGEIKSLLQPK